MRGGGGVVMGGGQEKCTSRACSHIFYIVYKKNSSFLQKRSLEHGTFADTSWNILGKSHYYLYLCIIVSHPHRILKDNFTDFVYHSPYCESNVSPTTTTFSIPNSLFLSSRNKYFSTVFDDDNCRIIPTSFSLISVFQGWGNVSLFVYTSILIFQLKYYTFPRNNI